MQCSLFILMLMCIKAQAVTRLSLSNKKCNCFSSSVSNVTQMRGWRDLGTAGARPCTGLGLGPLATGPGHWRSAPVWSNWDHGTMGTLYTSPAGCPHQHSRLHPRTTNVSSLTNNYFPHLSSLNFSNIIIRPTVRWNLPSIIAAALLNNLTGLMEPHLTPLPLRTLHPYVLRFRFPVTRYPFTHE